MSRTEVEQRAWWRDYYTRNKDKIAYQNKKWRTNNLSYYKKMARKNKLKARFNLSIEEYDILATKQNNLCAICNRKDSRGKRLSVDHNHKTGEVRGLLCHRCNTMLGCAEDRIDLLNAGAQYLAEARELLR